MAGKTDVGSVKSFIANIGVLITGGALLNKFSIRKWRAFFTVHYSYLQIIWKQYLKTVGKKGLCVMRECISRIISKPNKSSSLVTFWHLGYTRIRTYSCTAGFTFIYAFHRDRQMCKCSATIKPLS